LNADGTYSASVPIGNGTNNVTAIGYERFGRLATNTVSVAGSGLQYDANGNLLFDGQKGFAYDPENQLTNIVVTNSWKSEFVYDGLGRRRVRREYTWVSAIGNWQSTNEVRYVYDGLLPIQERDSNNAVKVTYTRGLDLSGGMRGAGGIGGLLARTDANGSAYYHADASGNITALIDSSQSIVAQYAYDPFGNVLSMSGSLVSANTMRFSSVEAHAQSGLMLYTFRAYSPSLQRFTQADPIGLAGGFNLHRFVGNSPINTVDPFGLSGWMDMRALPNYSGPSTLPSARPPTMEDIEAMAMMGATMMPGVGEAMDVEVLLNPDSAWWEKSLAGLSLGANAFTDGLLPNAGAFIKVCKKLPRFNGPKPRYTVNPAHVPGPTLRPGKTPLPTDAERVFENAVPNDPTKPTAWFGRNADGQIYRYSVDNNGTAHFSGINNVGDGTRNLTQYAIDRLNGL
jgi:RHS repeat-associated protein